jgi:hypothetical protein
VIGSGCHYAETESEYITGKTLGGWCRLLNAAGCGGAPDRFTVVWHANPHLAYLALLHIGHQAAGDNGAKPASQRSPSQHFCVACHGGLVELRIVEYLPAHSYENE